VSKTQEKLDSKLVLEQHPEAYEECLVDVAEKTVLEKVTVAIELEMYREYSL
jgi:hypothetical protein